MKKAFIVLLAFITISVYCNETKSLKLHSAIKSLNYRRVRTLMKRGADINYYDFYSDWNTPLSQAVKTGDKEMVELILSYNPDLDKLHFTYLGMMSILSRALYDKVPVEIIQVLLENGVSPNKAKGDELFHPLFNAIRNDRMDVIELLIKHNVDLSVKLPYGIDETIDVLHMVFLSLDHRDDEETVDLLLKSGFIPQEAEVYVEFSKRTVNYPDLEDYVKQVLAE